MLQGRPLHLAPAPVPDEIWLRHPALTVSRQASVIVGEATADIHMGLLIAVARRMVEGDRLARAGIFPGSQSSHLEGAACRARSSGWSAAANGSAKLSPVARRVFR